MSEIQHLEALIGRVETRLDSIEARINKIFAREMTEIKIEVALLKLKTTSSSRLNGLLGGFLPAAAMAIWYIIKNFK